MKYAIELYYDNETEKALFDFAQKIADKNISTKFLEWKTRPHITLACFNDVDETQCIAKLKDFAQNHKVMSAYIVSVGMFNNTKGWEWYCPNDWIPHCTIALTRDDEDDALSMCGKPIASNCHIRIFFYLFHFIGKPICNYIERSIIVISIYITDTWYFIFHSCQCNNRILSESF